MTGHEVTRLAILALLHREPAHGYPVVQRLIEAGVVAAPSTGGTYRLLRSLEEEGLTTSGWTTPARGPAARVYSLTPDGRAYLLAARPALHAHARALAALVQSIPR